MRERLTPLQRAICNALADRTPQNADEVYAQLELLRPDVADRTIAAAVRMAVGGGLERLAADGLIERVDTGASMTYRIASQDRLGARLCAEAA